VNPSNYLNINANWTGDKKNMPKTLYSEQDPKTRIKNFNEVASGYTPQQAVDEAKRCLKCKSPKCVGGCPVEINIPAFIKEVAEGNFEKALRIIKEKNNLPAVCGRVCPQETQCEKACILCVAKKSVDESVGIGRLERFAADWGYENKISGAPGVVKKQKATKIAIVGAGPAGLTCAADLASMGFSVTIFESLHEPGGVLWYGIPEFRLPKRILSAEINYIKSLGVEIAVNKVIGSSETVEDLKKAGFVAFFIGTGAGLPYFLGIEGEWLNGVYSANEFLTRVNLMKAYKFPEYDTPIVVGKRVAVIGAGNVAMDSARSALRLGAEEVVIVYRRTRDEMPARLEEIRHAEQEGIKFNLLTNPTKIFNNGNGWVKAMECVKNKLGEPDSTGRPRPVPIEGSEYTGNFDTVISAIGQGPNPLLLKSIPELKLNKKGYIEANPDTFATSIAGVYAGGDITTGAATVIEAMGAGKRAARSINEYLN